MEQSVAGNALHNLWTFESFHRGRWLSGSDQRVSAMVTGSNVGHSSLFREIRCALSPPWGQLPNFLLDQIDMDEQDASARSSSHKRNILITYNWNI